MAVGADVIRTSGRLVFELTRGGETTTRTIDIAYPISNSEAVQEAVNTANATFTSSTNVMNTLMQPANWRDASVLEEQWTTTHVRYEIVQTITTPVEPDSSSSVRAEEQQINE